MMVHDISLHVGQEHPYHPYRIPPGQNNQSWSSNNDHQHPKSLGWSRNITATQVVFPSMSPLGLRS